MPTYEDGLRDGFEAGWNEYIKGHTVNAVIPVADAIEYNADAIKITLERKLFQSLTERTVFAHETSSEEDIFKVLAVIGSVEDKINERVVRLDADL